MTAPDVIAAIREIVDLFERLQVPYAVAGSIASSAHGVARSTLDVDLVADLRREHVDAAFEALSPAYYVDHDAIADAVARRTMFNAIHLATFLKVDVYLLTARAFDRESFARRRPTALGVEDGGRSYPTGSPEDTVLHKLEWYVAGGRVSDRQWSDVLGVLKVQAGMLDLAYLRRWAVVLGVDGLVEQALAEAAG